MKHLLITLSLAVLFSNQGIAHEQVLLARVTGYWRNEGSGQCAAWNSAKLRAGHCAVDPKRIPYGSKVIFPDVECVAVDTGPAVVNRKSARFCGHNAAERNAIVVDRFFESKKEAVAWTSVHPQFMTLRIVTPDGNSKHPAAPQVAKGNHHSRTVPSNRGALTLAPLDPFHTSWEL
jgi:3D (Asp-Asp-Asp) domain-containing protein